VSTRWDEQEVPPQTGEGAQADSPLELTPPDWKESTRRAVKEFKNDRAGIISAGMAFYWFLAIFPSLLALVGILGLVNADGAASGTIADAARSALPGDAASVLTDALDKAAEGSDGAAVMATLVGLALALWGASAGMVALQSGLGVAYDVDQDRTFVAQRIRALLLLVVTAVLGGVATVLVVFGQPLGDAIRDNLPLGSAFVLVWTIARWVLALAALMVLFAAYYYLAPNRESPRWTWVSTGGILAAAIWLAASLGFSFYVASFGSYAETYGSLAGVVVLLLWLYLSAVAVMIGGEVNAELERQSAARAGQVDLDGDAPARPGTGTPAQAQEWVRRMREVRRSEAGNGSRALR
jgi:membrane protein